MTTCVTHINDIGTRQAGCTRNAARSRSTSTTRRWLTRLYALIAAIVLGSTIAYGEAWFLENAPSSGIDSVAAGSVARALAGDFTSD